MIKWLELSGAKPPNPYLEQKRKDVKMKDNNKTNYTNVTLNSTSRGCKAEPYPFSASAVIQSLFNFNKLSNGETCQGLRHWRLLLNLKNNFSRPVRNDMVKFGGVTRHPEGDKPKDLQTQNHVITRKNIEQEMQKSTQSDVVIPNKLGNSNT